MKVKALSRPQATVQRQNAGDLRLHHRNLDPSAHPMQRAREYTRAVTSAKIDRMFAAPLLGDLHPGHRDHVTCLAASRQSLLPFVSGGADGEVRIWDLPSRKMVCALGGGHARAVTGLVFDNQTNQGFYSCAEDGLVRSWSVRPREVEDESDDDKKPRAKSASTRNAEKSQAASYGPIDTWRAPSGASFTSMDHHWAEPQFATASTDAVSIWSPERSTPLQNHANLWGSVDTVNVVRYNPSERCLVAHCSADRGVGLHDIRAASALKKTVLAMRSNCLEWNPMVPYNFVVGNEDHNAYGFDMRKMDRPLCTYKGHVGAVTDVSWSPTGTEFVTGSYDKTMRIFSVRNEGGLSGGAAREIYHAKRMQRISGVAFTLDHKYILSGSEDMNVRLWKARASDRIGQQTSREERASEYREALVKKYVHMPEVKRIHKARRVPKIIKKTTAMFQIQKDSRRRKEKNVVKHSKKGTVKFTDEKKKAIVKTID